MASKKPLFDPSLKKRKKKQVAFTEDPLGPEADPTEPAPDTIDSTTLNGDAVDLGPVTAHEAMKATGDGNVEKEKEEDDFKAMFGDVKKKKKKKDIPMDLVSYHFHSSIHDSSYMYRVTIQVHPHPLQQLLRLPYRRLLLRTLTFLTSRKRKSQLKRRLLSIWMHLRRNSMNRRPSRQWLWMMRKMTES
jgi:hypothetical protein